MNFFSSFTEYHQKLTVTYNTDIAILEKFIEDVILSDHAKERMKQRAGELLNIPKIEVDKIVYSVERHIKDWMNKFRTFIIFDRRTELNIVGEIKRDKKKNGFDFFVITVMYKEKYISKYPEFDKYLTTTTKPTPVHESDDVIIYAFENVKDINEIVF